MEYLRPLVELRRADEGRFGGKSAGLGELLSAGIPVPSGFALSVSAFDAFLAQSGLVEPVGRMLATLPADGPDAIGQASRQIGEAMRSAPVPEAVREQIVRSYAQLGEDMPVAVRSSAIGEDGQDATYAGQQETTLWVRGADHVCDAVRDCWVSLYSTPAISYRLWLAGSAAPSGMGVAVQTMVDAAVSGVMFTCNPVSGDPSMVAINASWGLGLAVVGGDVTPDDYLISKVTREIVREHIHDKQVEYVPDVSGRGAVRRPVPASRRHARCLEDRTVGELVDIARRVETFFGSHQDVEWALGRDGTLFVVQSRPVTAMRQRATMPVASDAISLVMASFGAVPRNGPQ